MVETSSYLVFYSDDKESKSGGFGIMLTVLVVCILSSGFVSTLLYFHSKFVLNNLSTYVVTKMNSVVTVYGNPFYKGSWISNLKDIFFRNKHKRVDFKEPVAIKYMPSLPSNLFLKKLNSNHNDSEEKHKSKERDELIIAKLPLRDE